MGLRKRGEEKPNRTGWASLTIDLMVPSLVVEMGSRPYHGRVLPLNYEGITAQARYKLARRVRL
jgi:hypothetical protein